MLKKFRFPILLLISFNIVIFSYLLFPTSSFPEPISNSRVSQEPADLETSQRRGYYVDQSREELIQYYVSYLKKQSFINLGLPVVRLNYPPEESQVVIRDQTRSTYLEEVTRPFRESYFISGFEPKEDKDVIVVEGKKWNQKIVIKKVESSILARLLVGIFVNISLILVFLAYKSFVKRVLMFFK